MNLDANWVTPRKFRKALDVQLQALLDARGTPKPDLDVIDAIRHEMALSLLHDYNTLPGLRFDEKWQHWRQLRCECWKSLDVLDFCTCTERAIVAWGLGLPFKR